jgi:hypothetical protein
MVSIMGIVGLLPFNQIIDLNVPKGIFICILSQMEKRGGVFNAMNFRFEFFYLLSFLMRNHVALERCLDPLIISVSAPFFPWGGLWHIVTRPPATSVISILGISVHGLPL